MAKPQGARGVPRRAGKSATKIGRYWDHHRRDRSKIKRIKKEIKRLSRNADKNSVAIEALKGRLKHWEEKAKGWK